MGRRILRPLFALSLSMLACAAIAEQRPRVADEGAIRDEWMLAEGVQLAAPGYPAKYKDRGDSVCVAIGYSIDPKTGQTGELTLLKKWTSAGKSEPEKGYFDAYIASASAALSQWKFQPRPEVTAPRRTVTVATMTFNGKDGTPPAALRANCAIKNLAAFLQDHANKANRLDYENEMRYNDQRLDSLKSMQSLRPAGGGGGG